MKLITVAGPPSSGKTSVIIRTVQILSDQGKKVGVVKFDCLSATDETAYGANNIPVKTGLSGGLCPDHFFVCNIEPAIQWAEERKFDYLITESAGLCNRCSPHIKNIPAVCVIDNLSGVNTPGKIGPMLKTADIVIITKGDIVSQAEREVFAFKVCQVNPRAQIIHVNGITGQGSRYFSRMIEKAAPLTQGNAMRLRFTMPGALCSYCLGEKNIGPDKQIGISRLINFQDS